MSRQRKAPRQANERPSNAGGSATHAGIGFQNHAAAWIAVRILDEQNSSVPWELASTITLEQLSCETVEPTDDLLVFTSIGGCVFIQAKHSLKLEKGSSSDLASCLDQFTRQYHLGAWDAEKKMRRSLDATKDRMVILTSIHSPETIRVSIPTLLTKLHRLLPGQTSEDAVFSEKEQQHFDTIRAHIQRSWKAHVEETPSEADILQLLSFVRIQTLNIDEGGNDELWAKDMLRRSILQDPTQADSAWDRLYRTFANRSITHSGVARKTLQQILLDARIEINAARSYRSDIEYLQSSTSSALNAIYSESRIIIGQEIVKINRPSVRILQAAATEGSLVVLGLPGVGKSVALYDLATALRAEGKDIVFFTADAFVNIFRLTHDTVDVLRNWPGSQPAFLFIDALDTARFSQSERTLWDLITQMMTVEIGNRWRVIVSTRIFDATKNTELRRLFAGPPPEEMLQDKNFPYLRHIMLPPLSTEELQQATEQSPTLAPLLNEAGPDLQDLLRIPFNLRLVKDLLLLGTHIRDLVQMRAQIQLLDLYWSYRVEQSDRQQYAREWVLRQACTIMVDSQMLHVDLALLASPASSQALYDLQNEHILMPWRPDAHSGADASIVTFSHRILFDYAVACLLLSGDPQKNILDRLAAKPTLAIAIRPSLVYRFQKEWMRNPTRSLFWVLTLLLLRNETIPNLGKLVGPTVATEFATHLIDFVPLLTWLEDEDRVRQQEAEKALQHVVGAIIAQQHRPSVGIGSGPWSELLVHISQVLRPSLAFLVRILLSHVVEHPVLFTPDQQDQIGKSARLLFEFAWDQPARDATFMYFALQGVCRTYKSDPSASQSLLRRCLEPSHLSIYGYEELPVIAREMTWLIAPDPQFASDIYIAAFSYEETSEEKTPLGASQILSLQSTRRQEYSSALYAFAEAYPQMLQQNSLVALQTLIQIMDYQRPRDNDPLKEAFFDFNGVQARIQFESISFWSTLDDLSLHDPLGQMIIAFVTHLAHIATDSQFADERRSLIQLMIAKNRHGLLWRRLLMEGTDAPQTLGQEIRSLAWAVPILTASATFQVVGAFLAVLFDKLIVEERERVERAILSIPTTMGLSIGEQMRDRLLGCLPSSALVIEESKAYVEQFNAKGGVPSNEPFIPAVVEWRSEQSEGDEAYQHFRRTIQTFIAQHQQTPPTTQEVEAIFPLLQALEMALSSLNMSQEADPRQLLSALGDLAEASECIIGWNEFSCTSTIGQFVLSVLLNVSTYEEPVYSLQNAIDFDKSINWGKPAPRIDAARGLPRLAFQKTCASTTVLDAIKRLSSDPVPAVRYNVARNIRSLYQTEPDMMWEILEQACENELSRGALLGTLSTLQSLVNFHPNRIFELTKKIYDRVPSEAGAVLVRKACISTFTWLYFRHDHTLSHQIVLAAADKPDEYADENGQMLVIARQHLNFGSVTSSNLHTTQDAVRQRAWSIIKYLARSVTQALQQHIQQSEEVGMEKDDKPQQLRSLLRLIDVIGSDLYFASGASNNSNEQEKSLEEKKRFWTEVEPLLDILDIISVRNVTHHLLQMLEFLAPANPSSIFLRIGHMVLNGKESGYQYESFAVDLIVRAIERYLAEFREVFREDGECLQMLIHILDIFVDVGWPSAMRLAYRIDVIFQ